MFWFILFTLLKWYLWTLGCAVTISFTLAVTGYSFDIRKTSVKLLLKVFEEISKRIHDTASKEEDFSDDNLSEAAVNQPLIKRDASASIFRKMSEFPVRSKAYTFLDDSLEFLTAGMESIIEDDVTCRFSNEQLQVWNFLTRTSYGHIYNTPSITVLWMAGFFIRYFALFPMRFIIFTFGMILLILSSTITGLIKDTELKQRVYRHTFLMCHRVLSCALSIIATYHDRENRAKPGSICVANHTSPMDVQVLSMDNCYSLVGQKHGSFLGFIQDCLSNASAHVWFERSEANDRSCVRNRLQQHISNKSNMPILIFPEGTCINNTSVMMFKKGSFEIEGALMYPVAIKYDPRLGDAFWNSSKLSYFKYMLELMTSWATVVDVWYLQPVKKFPDEDGASFAARVKHEIAIVGGLTELDWDGQLKRYPVKQEAVEQQRKRWGRRVNRAFSIDPTSDIH